MDHHYQLKIVVQKTDMDSNLYEEIKKLGSTFIETANGYSRDGMESRPEWAHYYFQLASEYAEAADVCEKYCETLNLDEFISKMRDLDFTYRLDTLIKYIKDPALVTEITEQVEKNGPTSTRV